MKKRLPSILVGLLFLVGLGIMIYPTVSNQWNTYRQNKLISNYEKIVDDMSDEDFSQEWQNAQAFNETISGNNVFADVGMGIGTIVIGLASVIIGEVILGSDSFSSSLMAVVLGSIIYRIVIAAVLHLGMPPNDLKLFTAIIVMFALATPLIKEKANLGKAG